MTRQPTIREVVDALDGMNQSERTWILLKTWTSFGGGKIPRLARTLRLITRARIFYGHDGAWINRCHRIKIEGLPREISLVLLAYEALR